MTSRIFMGAMAILAISGCQTAPSVTGDSTENTYSIVPYEYASSEVLESKHFLMKYPDNWKVVNNSDREYLLGPNSEKLSISIIPITGYKIASGGSEADWRRHRKEFGEYVVSKMQKASKDSDLRITSPLFKIKSASGFPVWEIRTVTAGSSRFFNLYGVTGLRVVLFITLEGKIKDESKADEILSSIKNIEWK